MIGLVLDIETTGWLKIDQRTATLPDSSEILEVGYMRIDTETFEIYDYGELYFYKDYFQVDGTEAQRTHKLQSSFLRQFKDDFDLNLIKLNSLIQQTAIIGKNSAKFDIPYIDEFIQKHSSGVLHMGSIINKASIKRFDEGGYLNYNPWFISFDIQEVFADTFRNLYYAKYKELLSGRRTGQLEEYIDVTNLRGEVDKLYNSLENKKRIGGAHSALYDVCMTYVIYKYCIENNIGNW